ncbi:MAG: quinone-dependent dihydroorotate dehydrogenase [Myxococcales bacterium]|nr:quinone-dependent dihydroorotate dehydrogenase [Myxococcales bacterium]
MSLYGAVRPLLFQLDPERAHRLTFGVLKGLGAVGRWAVSAPPPPGLDVTFAGIRCPSPVGLAAGLDKDGELIPLWPAMGFGYAELGTATALAQPGNPAPRLFRFPEHGALVNRMGFNGAGAAALAERLAAALPQAVPIGVNLGKSKVTPLEDAAADYAASARLLAPHAAYIVVNVSSPNTPGLRTLQDGDLLGEIVRAVAHEAQGKPIFVKLSPDLEPPAIADAVEKAEAAGAAGFIATNTTLVRRGLGDVGAGGLSGAPLHDRALEVVRWLRALTTRPIIGVGGIRCPATAFAMFAAGADAIQLYTGFIYEGPGLVARINRALRTALDVRGLASVAELVQQLRQERL